MSNHIYLSLDEAVDIDSQIVETKKSQLPLWSNWTEECEGICGV